ncbi:hypothetical protein WJX77_002071 [Trebouxia sp. C0004]
MAASETMWTSKAKILLVAVVLSCYVCENWASREPSLGPVTSLQEFDCDENYKLCIVQRTGACHFLQDTYHGLNVVGQPDATQFQAAQKLNVVPTIIDFTNLPSSVVPKWPAALC